MQEKILAEQNKILEIVTGSHLYGTATETSDKDFVGVFLPDVPHILGFKTVEEVDSSIVDKNEEGKILNTHWTENCMSSENLSNSL